MEAVLLKKWEVLATRYDELTNQLMDPSLMSQPSQLRKVNKERTDIEPAAKLLATYRDNARQLEEAAQILADPTAGVELHKMATEESATLEGQQREIEQQAQELLIPKDPRDEKSLLLEIRAGTGGDEAALLPERCSACTPSTLRSKASRSMWSKPQKPGAGAIRGSSR